MKGIQILKLALNSLKRRDEITGYLRRLQSDLYCLPNVILLIVSSRTMCVGMWRGWGRDILWFVVGKLEGTKHLEPLGIDGSIILNGYSRNGFSLDWDDLCLEGDFWQAVVITTVNHWVAWNVWNFFTNWGTVRLLGRILLRGVSDYFV